MSNKKPKVRFTPKINSVTPFLSDMDLLILGIGILSIAGMESGLPAITSRASHCRNGWSHYEGSCYLFVTAEQDTWIEAISHCKSLHGYLTDVLDEKENAFIKSQLQHTHASVKERARQPRPGCYYISATDVEVEGQWVWPNTDNHVEYTDWAPTEPQNAFGGENCICLSAGENFQWVDVTCHSLRHFICKMRLDDETGPGIIG